tara:strand:+ start:154 stop:402 length:249 start_codon:yes stop_codon:yes gene_type:complete
MSRVKANARKIGVEVKPSTRKNKKIDVFNKAGKKLASIGDPNLADYTKHRDETRRKAFKARFQRLRTKRGTPAYFSDRLLWE